MEPTTLRNLLARLRWDSLTEHEASLAAEQRIEELYRFDPLSPVPEEFVETICSLYHSLTKDHQAF